MKDFLKIFGILCFVVGAFLLGRTNGEEKFRQSEEYQNLLKQKTASEFNNNELQNVKTKFQNIVDNAETKKTEELLAQILQVFLADLGLRIQNQQAFLKESTSVSTTPPVVEPTKQNRRDEINKAVAESRKDSNIKKMRSWEWMITNAEKDHNLNEYLKNLEIKSLNDYLEKAKPAPLSNFENIFGSYRGRIFYQDSKEYSTLIFEVGRLGPDNARIKVEGNTDERGSREYNLALGQKRSESVKRVLMLLGVSEAQIDTVSFGEEKPRNTAANDAAYAENRRCDLAYAGE